MKDATRSGRAVANHPSRDDATALHSADGAPARRPAPARPHAPGAGHSVPHSAAGACTLHKTDGLAPERPARSVPTGPSGSRGWNGAATRRPASSDVASEGEAGHLAHGARAVGRNTANRALHALLIAALTSSALSPATPALAQSATPASAPPLQVANSRTSLDVTPAGTPIVNIATPDAGGVSHNVYTTLSAGKEGLIFNNSPVVGQSTVGGFLLANPNLAGGQGANLILNEVTGGVRTSLAGPVEVFGQKAALVIANPTGITCDGCGFLNTGRVSLAAASLTFGADGAFSGFRTSGGDVSIEGKGLLAGNVDYFDIIAAVTHINASLYAKDLVVAGGTGTFDYATRTITVTAPTAPAAPTGVAIDSAALGGMYANRIRLIGTGQGVGINLAGTVAALDGPLAITSDGAITLAKAVSTGDATITSANGAVTLTDQTYAGGNLAITGSLIRQGGGFAGALGNVALTSAQDTMLGGTGVYAGLDSNGALTGTGRLSVDAGGALGTGAATLAAGGALALHAAALTQSAGGQITGAGLTVTTTAAQDLAGALRSSGDATLAGDTIDLTGSLGANGNLALSGRLVTLAGTATGLGGASASASEALSITGTGALQSNGSASLTAPTLANAGTVLGGSGVALGGAGLANSGSVQSGGDLVVTTTGDAALGGTVSANGKATLAVGGTVALTGSLGAGQALEVQAASLSVSGTAQARTALALGAARDLTVTGTGEVLADGPASLTAAGALTLAGQVGSNDALGLSGKAIDLSGTAQAQGRLTLTAADLSLSGQALSANDIAATTTRSVNITGTLSASGDLTLAAPTLTTGSNAQVLAGKALAITTPGAFSQAGTLSAASLTVSADGLANTGALVSTGDMALTGTTSLTQAGAVQAGGNLTLTAPSVTLAGKTYGAVKDGQAGITLAVPTLAFTAASDLESGGSLDVAVTGDLATQGKIVALGAASLASQGALTQNAALSGNDAVSLKAATSLVQTGNLIVTGPISLTAPTIVNSGSVTGSATLSLTASHAITSSGALLSDGALSLTAPTLDLSGATVTNDVLTLTAPTVMLGGTTSGVKGVASQINNLTLTGSGTLQSGDALDLTLVSLDNAGLISSTGALDLWASAGLVSSGKIVSGTTLGLAAGKDLTSSGLLQSGTDLTATIGGAATLSGTLHAGGNAGLAAASLASAGALSSQGTLTIATAGDATFAAGASAYARSSAGLSAANLTTAGSIQSDGALSLTASKAMTLGGNVQGAGITALVAGTSANVTGTLASGGALSLTAPTVSLPGQILANDTVTITANADNPSTGSGGTLALAGTIQAAKDVALTAVRTLTIGTPGASPGAGGGTPGGSGTSGGAGGGTGGGSGSGTGAGPDSGSGSGSGTGTGTGSGSFAFTGPQLATPVPGSLASNGAVTLTAADIEIDGLVVAKGDLSALASHVLTVKGSAWSDSALGATAGSLTVGQNASFAAVGAVKVTAVSDIANLGTIASNAGDVTLSYGGAFSNTGVLSAKGAFSVTTAADYAAAGTVSANTIAIAARDITLSGTTIAATGLSLSGRAITLAHGSDTESAGTLSLTGSTSGALAGKLVATHDLTAQLGATLGIAASADIETGGTLSLRSDGDLATLAGSKLAAQGAAALSGANLSLAGTLATNASLNLATPGNLALAGTASALGDATVSAGASTTSTVGLTGTLASGRTLALTGGTTSLGAGSILQAGDTLALTAAALTSGGTLQAANGLTLTSAGDANLGGTLIAGSVDASGTVTSLADLSLTAAGKLGLTGNASATGKASLGASILDLGGSLVALGDVNLTAATLTTSGSAKANGTLTANTSGNATLGGTLAGLAGLTVNSGTGAAGGDLVQNAALGSNGKVTLSTSGTLTHSGTTSAAGDIGVTGATLSLGGTLASNGALALTSTSGPVTLVTGGALSAKHVTLTSAGDASVAGTLAATADLTARIAGTLTLASTGVLQAGTSDASGNVTSTGTMVLGAGSAIRNAGWIGSTGSLRFDTPSLVNTGTISTGADIDLSAASLSLGGTFVSLGNVSVSATAGPLAVSGGLEGRNVTLSASGGDLTLGTDSHLTAYGTGSDGRASLTTTGALAALGTIAANADVTLKAGGDMHIGSDPATTTGATPAYALSTSGAVSLLAGGALVNDGTVQAGKALTLSASRLTSNSLLTGGALTFSTPGDIALTGTTYGAGGVALTSTNGTLSLASTASVQSPGAIALEAAGDLSNAGVISAGVAGAATPGTLRLTSGGALTSTGALVSNNDGISLTGASLTLGGALASSGGSSGGVYAARGLVLAAPVLTLRDGGQVVANDSLSFAGSSLTLGAGSLLQSNHDLALTLGAAGAPGSFTSAGSLVALGDLALTVTGGAITNQAGGGLFAGGSGSARAGGSITLTAASLANAGSIVASADAAGARGNLAISAGTVTTSGLIHADRTLGVTASSLTIDGSLGTVEAGSAITWSIPTLTLGNGGTLKSAAGITLATTTLSNAGAILAGDDLALSSTGDLSSTGTLATPGSLSLASGTTLTLGSASQTFAGGSQATPAVTGSAIALTAPTISALGTLAATGALAFKTDSLTVGGSAVANGDVTLAGASAAAPALTVNAGGTLASYLGNANLGTLASAYLAGTLVATHGDIGFTSPSTTITATGKLAAGGNAALATTGGGVLTLAGQIIGGNDVTLTGGTLGVAGTGLVQAGHDLRFTTGDTANGTGTITVNGTGYDYTGMPGSARIAGTLRAGHDLALVMPGVFVADGSAQIIAGNDLALAAGHALIGARYTTGPSGTPLALGLVAGHDLTIASSAALPGLAARGLVLDGSLQAGNTLTVNASGEVTSTAAAQMVAGNTLAVTGSALSLAGFNSGEVLVRFTATGNSPAGVVTTLTPGVITLSGATVSNGRVSLAANTATIASTGSITTHGGSTNAAAVGRDIGVSANIDLETVGALVNNGALWSDGVVFLKSASGDVVNNATGANGGITAATIVTQTDNGAFRNQAGAFKAANAGLFLGGDFVNSGAFAPSGNYWISAANIRNSGLLATSGSLTLDAAGNLTNTGTIFSGNRLTLRVGGALTNDYAGDDNGNGSHGLILAQNDIAITAHDVFNTSATIQSLAGSIGINLTGGNLSNTIKTLVISEVPGTGVASGLYVTSGVHAGPSPDGEASRIFNIVGCGGQNTFANGVQGVSTFTCSGSGASSTVTLSYINPGYGGYTPPYAANCAPTSAGMICNQTYALVVGRKDSIASSNTGTSTISAAVNLTINAGNGAVANRNSAILAGAGISISTGGEVTNSADLLVRNVTSGTTTTATNTTIPGAPTLIQAGGTVSIQAGTFSNVANNLVGADTYTGLQVLQHTAPGTPGASTPGTGSSAINATATTGQAAGASGAAITIGGAAATTSGSQGFSPHGAGAALSASGDGAITLSLVTARRSGAQGSDTGATVTTLTDATALAGGSGKVGPVAVGNVTSRNGDASATALVAGSADGTGLTGGSAVAIGALASVTPGGGSSLSGGAGAVSPLAAGLVSAFNGASLPGLSNQGFGTFLGSFLSSFNLTGNAPSLFTYNSNPDSAYLFTTSASLASQAALYDSSYFFNRLAPDRATTYTRLGDGFFEAMLVTREVQAATGTAQLAGFGSALDQYQGLLRNAADQQAGLGLQMGVALTDAQVAQLTSPMLWYVSARVEGRDVLVPVLYLAASDSKAIRNSALVGGNNVLVSANGDVTNSGTITARNVVALAANGGDLVNAKGGTIAGGSVVASAANDILLQGGSTITANGAGTYALANGQTLSGGTVSLSAGHDIATSTVTGLDVVATGSRISGTSWANTYTATEKATGATISSSKGTQLTAAGDVALNAATLSSDGAIDIVVGRNVSVSGTTTSSLAWQSAETGKYANSTSTTTTNTFTGTTIAAGGPVTITALGGTLAVTGSSIQTTNAASGAIDLYGAKGVSVASAQDNASLSEFEQTGKNSTITTTAQAVTNDLVSIKAAGDLTIATPGALAINGGTLSSGGALGVSAGSVAVNGVIDSQSSDVATWKKKSGFLSSTTTTTHTVTSDQTAVASTLSGDTLQVTTPGAVTVTGSNLVASNGLGIAAGGPVTIGAMTETDSSSQTVSVRKSGLSVSFSGIGYGSLRSTTTATEIAVTQAGSLVGSANGDVTIHTADALTVLSSDIVAGGKLDIAAKSLDIAALANTDSQHQTQDTHSWGIGIGLGGPAGNVLRSANSLAVATTQAANTNDGRVQALAGIAAARSAYDLGQSILGSGGLAHLSPSEIKNATSLNIGFSSSSSHAESTTDRTSYAQSLLSAGETARIAIGGDATIAGGAIKANGVDLDVGGNLTIASTQDSERQSYHSKASRFGLGVSVGLTGGISGSASFGKSTTDGTANWQSVTQQSGVFAGDDGYRVNVGGDLAMKAGVIGSNATAASKEANSLSVAGSTRLDDLTNSQSQSITSRSSGFTLSTNPGQMAMSAVGAIAGALLPGKSNHAESSTTQSVITGNDPAQAVAFGQTAGGAIAPLGTSLADAVATQQARSAALQAASVAVAATLGDIGTALLSQRNEDGTPKYDKTTIEAAKALLHGVSQAGLAALAGGDLSTALAAGVSGAIADPLAAATVRTVCGGASDPAACASSPATRAIVSAIGTAAGAALGAAAGNTQAGALAASDVVQFNYLTHAQLVSRATELNKCKGDTACITDVDTRYANLSAVQDLDMAIACQGEGLPSCSSMKADYQAYVDGSAFKATGINRLIDVGSNWFGSSAIKLDEVLKTDILRSSNQSSLADIAAGEIVVTMPTKWMQANGITEDKFGQSNLSPTSVESQLYDKLPKFYAQDQATRSGSVYGSTTKGQLAIASGEFQSQLNTIQTLAAVEATAPCALSGLCTGVATAYAVVDCARNPGLANCSAAAVGVVVPGLKAAGALRAAGAEANLASKAEALANTLPKGTSAGNEIALGGAAASDSPFVVKGVATAIPDTRAPLAASSITVSFDTSSKSANALDNISSIDDFAKNLGSYAAETTPELLQVGGAYRDVKGIPGYEAHHMPADSISPLSTGEGPSIAMPVDDHRLTASWGSSRAARAYRQTQADLIAQGDFRGAQQLDINDINAKFGNRYDDAIQQMLRYSQSKGH